MSRFLLILTAALACFAWAPLRADSSDIDAAARGVVRVVIFAQEGDGTFVPVTHGTGFAVATNRFVTNAHVVRDAVQDDTLRIGIVPSEGGEVVFARAQAVNPRNDLALLEVVDGTLRMPALTIAGGVEGNMSEVSAVGYPMNVDLAQGLEVEDIFRAQPPVKSRGFLSGERPSREFDTILHTAPIARGNSGGPLLDGCGRVVGVNSFGADSDGSDAEFYFAVSREELLPFLRENGVDPRTNAMPCRSIDELNAAERDRFDAERAEARQLIAAREAENREERALATMQAQMDILDERENAMALAMVLLLVAIGSGYTALQLRSDHTKRARLAIFIGLSSAAMVGAVFAWFSRPGFSELDGRVAALLGEIKDGEGDEGTASSATEGTLTCVLDADRSRVTSARTDDVEFDWSADGCVNGRTQYGLNNGQWSRAFVPNEEQAVSINGYDPETRTFRTERYLLRQSTMEKARSARGEYTPPECGTPEASVKLGDQQSRLLALLPDRPNERLVYQCEIK